MRSELSRRALKIKQSDGIDLFLFALTAEEILEVADISRVGRGEQGDLIGYQRPAVRQHVDNIASYLDSAEPLFPNAIILALGRHVHFTSSRGPRVGDGYATSGTLTISMPGPGEQKPGWIVDGQQRALALSRTKNRHFPVPVSAFIAESLDVQRDQFLRVNSTHPLPRGLVTELLPTVSVPISPKLSARKLPAALCDEMNRDAKSPFYKLIRQASTPGDARSKAVVTDTSLVRALEDSLNQPSGCLFSYLNVATGETDVESIWKLITWYWAGVKDTFPEAWGKPATQSRLMHGVGIRSMGRLMDRVMSSIDPADETGPDKVRHELSRIANECHWTSGTWEDLGLAWNELQNVPRHIRMLSNYLVRLYVQTRASAG